MDYKLYQGAQSIDDRGYVTFVNDFNFQNVKRFYQVENHEAGFIRAWHGHVNEGKYVFVSNGSIKLKIAPLVIKGDQVLLSDKSEQFYLTSRDPKVLYIPPGFANGFQTLEPNTKALFFSTSTLEESKGDDYRFDWDKNDNWEINFR